MRNKKMKNETSDKRENWHLSATNIRVVLRTYGGRSLDVSLNRQYFVQ